MSEFTPQDPEADDSLDDDLDAVREALDDLRREIRERFGGRGQVAPDASAEPGGVGLGELVGELRQRFGRMGMVERSGEVDEFGMDAAAIGWAAPLLDFLMDRYWRVEIEGLEHVPSQGPYLLVANRSGLLPWDGLLLAHAIERLRTPGVRPRFFVADWLMTLPFAMPMLTRLGGVRACRENAERLLHSGIPVIVFPEGAKGATKVFRERYRLKRFGRGGVIRVAIESGVPLVPVGVVGAEEAHPVLFKSTSAGRSLGLPFVPFTPTFPLLGPLGAVPLPSKWVVRFGAPIGFDDLGAEAAHDELLMSRLTENLRQEIQALVQGGLDARESVWS
jgi:1-acyl-sn-glycerol-3-phosphate acyltransferase